LTPTWENTTEADFDLEPIERGLAYRIRYKLFSLIDEARAPTLWREMLDHTTCLLAQIPKSLTGIEGNVTDRIRMVGLATDTDTFTPSESRFDRPTILFLAKLNRRKGLDYLIQAMPRILERIPDAHLRVVGDGPARNYFEETSRQCGVTDSVTFEGLVEHAQTVDYYQRADVYCLPSVGEPAANSLLEAMAAGCPIVSTAAGGVPEIVDHEKAGLLVPPRDSNGLADALIRILSDDDERRAMQSYCRATALERHNIVGLVDRIEQAYEWALEANT